MVAVADSLKGRSFTRVADWSRDELESVLDLADELKERRRRREEHRLLPGRTLAMIFQKPSTRTRVSFEVGIAQLGGVGLDLAASDLQLGRGETIKDTAAVLSRYVDAIMIRTYAQADVEELDEHGPGGGAAAAPRGLPGLHDRRGALLPRRRRRDRHALPARALRRGDHRG